MKTKKKIILMIVIALILLIFDQSLKFYCRSHREIQSIFPGVRFIYEESNKGAFGVGQNSIMTYVISTFIVLGIVLKFFFNQIERINIGIIVGISFILAGGFSNMIDKILYGVVIHCIQLLEGLDVNLSFIFIVIGWIELAAIFAFHTWKEMRKKDA